MNFISLLRQWKGLAEDSRMLRMNVKTLGYELAGQLHSQFMSLDCEGEPRIHGLVSKPTTQADFESAWFRYWCRELHIAPIYHRKIWEFAFVLQVLHEQGMLVAGKRGAGFGCGEEPIASLLAARDLQADISDLPPEDRASRGWVRSKQHASSPDKAFKPNIVARDRFDAKVRHSFIDMNRLPEFPEPYDFCWSICAFEHLGSIENGLAFVGNALKAVKPGGIAVHTTEYNFLSEDKTIDRGTTVLYLRKHLQELERRLRQHGHTMLGPDFDAGKGVLDRFVDIPPYWIDQDPLTREHENAGHKVAHIKLLHRGFPCTCYGIAIRKAL